MEPTYRLPRTSMSSINDELTTAYQEAVNCWSDIKTSQKESMQFNKITLVDPVSCLIQVNTPNERFNFSCKIDKMDVDTLQNPQTPEEKRALLISKIASKIFTAQSAHQQGQVERAKRDIQADPNAIKDIEKYNIQNEWDIVEITKMALLIEDMAGIVAATISEYISYWQISKEKCRIEIAKNVARCLGWMTLLNIKDFKIDNQEALIEIAKIAIENNVAACAAIDYCGIKDERAMIDIAMFAAAQRTKHNQFNGIIHFKIKDKAARIEIAKIAARYSPEATSKLIGDYQIGDQKILFEIARICAQSNGVETSKNIQHFKLENPIQRCDVFVEACRQSPESSKHYQLYELEGVLPFLLRMWPEVNFSDLTNFIESETDTFTKKRMLIWLTFAMGLFYSKRASTEQISWTIHQKTLLTALQFRDPHLKFKLLEEVVEVALSRGQRAQFEKLHEGNPEYTCLPHLYLAQLQEKCRNISSACTYVRNKQFKSPIHLKHLLHFLILLTKEKELDENDLNVLLRIVFKGTCSEAIEKMKSIHAIISLSGFHHLKDEVIKKGNTNFGVILFDAFRQKVPIPEIRNFEIKYKNTFATFRDLRALFIHAAYIASLKNSSKMKKLQWYLTSVLEGTFKEERYAKLEICQPVLMKWKSDYSPSFPGNQFGEGLKVVITDDPCDLLLQGTEVSNCYNVYSNPSANESTLKSITNGTRKLVAIKDLFGKLIAVADLKLWPTFPNTSGPVMVMDRIYSNIGNSYNDVLIKASCEYAQFLGVGFINHYNKSL